jgi:hypothetical protein
MIWMRTAMSDSRLVQWQRTGRSQALAVSSDELHGLFVGQVLHAMNGLEVTLDPETFIRLIDETECVTAKAMQMAIASGQPAITEENRH